MPSSFSRKLPSIPSPRGKGITDELARILRPMKLILENLIVERDRNDLQAIDIESIIEQVQENIDLGLIDPGTSNQEVTRPTGLTVSGDVKNITLTWDAPAYSNHAYTEVYRSTTNDRPTATRIGTTAGATFVDKTANKNFTYYYWIRFYSSGNIYGPFNAADTSGTSGTLAAISLDEFAAGTAPVEYLGALPTVDLTDGRTVYNTSDNTLNVYETSAWTTYYPGAHPEVIVPVTGSDLSNAVTISTAAWNTVGTVSIDVGAAADYTTIIVMVTGWLDANATPGTATTIDLRFTYDAVAQFTENGIAVPVNGSPTLYSRNYAIAVPGADTGSKTVEFQAWMAGTASDFTDLHMTVVGYA